MNQDLIDILQRGQVDKLRIILESRCVDYVLVRSRLNRMEKISAIKFCVFYQQPECAKVLIRSGRCDLKFNGTCPCVLGDASRCPLKSFTSATPAQYVFFAEDFSGKDDILKEFRDTGKDVGLPNDTSVEEKMIFHALNDQAGLKIASQVVTIRNASSIKWKRAVDKLIDQDQLSLLEWLIASQEFAEQPIDIIHILIDRIEKLYRNQPKMFCLLAAHGHNLPEDYWTRNRYWSMSAHDYPHSYSAVFEQCWYANDSEVIKKTVPMMIDSIQATRNVISLYEFPVTAVDDIVAFLADVEGLKGLVEKLPEPKPITMDEGFNRLVAAD